VRSDRLFMYQGTLENMPSGLRVYRGNHVLSNEARQWFFDTGLVPQYELYKLVFIGQPWMATFYFESHRDATLFKLTFG